MEVAAVIRPKRRKSRAILWAVLILVLLVAAGAITLSVLSARLANVTIDPVDLARVADGQYVGEYAAFPVTAGVLVTVVDHRVTDIGILKHVTGQGKPGEAVIPRVIEAQTLSVDAVAGATYSSKVILKATELALRQGIK